jgi:hypothetical protein
MMQADRQLEFYRTRFGKMPSKLQLDIFKTDLARLNLDVMSAALKQAEAVVQATKRPPRDVRLAVLAQYDRVLASIGQLFPVFFIFESAWRSYAAARLSLIYGRDDWWHGVRDAVAQKKDPRTVTRLGTLPARTEVLVIVSRILAPIQAPGGLSSTYDLMAEATLGQVERLIGRHWTDMSSPFSSPAGSVAMTSGRFEALFAKVRRARNDAYHHRTVSDRAGTVSAAEQLLDLLDLHLGDRVAAVSATQLPSLAFRTVKEPRHG